MYKLEEVVNKAISSGVRIGFSKQSSQGKKAYNFVDHVIEKISKLEKNPKVASNIICKLYQYSLLGRQMEHVINLLNSPVIGKKSSFSFVLLLTGLGISIKRSSV